jgi:hypothetical protein
MACICRSCVEHCRILGVSQALTSKHAIHKAYRAAAKRWHPDRFESDEHKRLDAEERFKRIQSAYQQLCEHLENPLRMPQETEYVTPLRTQAPPTIFFGGAPGCFVGPHFPAMVRESITALRLQNSESPVGFVDLAPERASISRYILLTNHRMYIRDATQLLTVVWYDDLGDIRLVDRDAGKKPSAWRKLFANLLRNPQKYELHIYRHNGSHFYTLRDRPDDRVKKVIYNFLLQMKSKTQG